MSESRVLKTRIALLYKTYAEWDDVKDSYIPLKGEVCFCEVPYGTGTVTQEPALLLKAGDGVKTFAQLPWMSGLAADVFNWAKKENLEWVDFTDSLKESIKAYVGGAEKNTLYQIVADGPNKWKLQKSDDKGSTWQDATGVIDLSATIAALEASIAKKVDKQIVGTNGTAEIFNESDGGGAHFIHNDGTESFVGVNDGGKDGLVAQIYADRMEDGSWKGSKINIYHKGIYYVSYANQKAGYAKDAAEMEIATKKDIQDLGQALHFVGIAEKKEGETEIQAVERTFPAAQQKAGAVAICGSKEFICCGTPLSWREFGDVSQYATKAELDAETAARTDADLALDAKIAAEETRAKAEEAKKADLPGECPPWLNPTGETPYPWFMASLDVESAGLGPDAEGNLKANVGAYNFNAKQYYKWEKNLPFAATQSKAGLMTAADKAKLDHFYAKDLTQEEGDVLIFNCNF